MLTDSQLAMIDRIQGQRANMKNWVTDIKVQSENHAQNLIREADKLAVEQASDDYTAEAFGDGANGTTAYTIEAERVATEAMITKLLAVCGKTRQELTD